MYRKEQYSKIASKPLRYQLAISFAFLCVGFGFTLWADVSNKESESVFESFIAHGGGIIGFKSWLFAIAFPIAHLLQRSVRISVCSTRHQKLMRKSAQKAFYAMLITALSSLAFMILSYDWSRVEPTAETGTPYTAFFMGLVLAASGLALCSSAFGVGYFIMGFTSHDQVARTTSE